MLTLSFEVFDEKTFAASKTILFSSWRCDLGLDQVRKFLKWISLKIYFSKIDIEKFELVGVLKLLGNKWPLKFIQIILKKYWLFRLNLEKYLISE